MDHRSKTFLWTSALVAPWLALSVAWAETVDVTHSDQDNVSFVGASESEIEHLIRLLGPDSFGNTLDGTAGPDDGIPVRLHRIADQIVALYEDRQYKDLISLLQENSDVRAARPEVNQLEAWSFYHSGRARTAMKLFQELYVTEPTPTNAAGVIYSGMRSEYYTKTYEFAKTQGGPLAEILKPGEKAPTDKPKDAIEKTQLDFLNGWLRAAIRYEKFTTADKVARLLGFDGTDEIRSEMLVGFGWRAHKAGNFGKAANYFGKVADLEASPAQAAEALYGHALSLRDAGQLAEAAGLLRGAATLDARMALLLGEITLRQGHDAFEVEDFGASLELARSAQSPDNDPRTAWMLEGWSLFNLDRAEEAAGVFVPAYRKLPDQESADGVTASLMALGRRGEIVELAGEVEGPLKPPPETVDGTDEGVGAAYVMSEAERAFYRGDFATATAFRPELGEILAPWMGVTLSYKFRDGDEGLGKLNMTGSKASYSLIDKALHVRGEFEVLYVDTGAAPSDPDLSGFGALSALQPFAPSVDDALFQPSLHFRNEGIWGTDVSVGSSPINGEVAATVTGHVDVIHSRDGGRYSAGLHRMTIYESLLSISGMKDTVTGTSWGGVVETGLHFDLYHPLRENFALTAQGSAGERTGRYVDTNQTRFFSLGAVYSFDAKGFSYLAVGPSFRYTGFDKNRSFFTFGHGGYYSPAEVHAVSLNLNFMTEENRNWIARGSLSAGYEEAESDAAPFYPLFPIPGDPGYLATSTEGPALAFEAVAARRINDDVIAEFGAYGIETEDYSEAGAFIKLRVSFGKRSKVWRTDLTEDLHRKYR